MTPPLQTVRCPSCDAIQTAPASSPRGFALHLRCSACATPLGDNEVTRLAARLEVPVAPVREGWAVVVEGEVVGPVSADEIRCYHRASVIDDQALVWHEGFRGWARLSETLTFRALCSSTRPAPQQGDAVVNLTKAPITTAGSGEGHTAREIPVPPVVAADTTVAAEESAVMPMAATAGIYPIPRTSPRLVPLLVATAVAVGLATVGGAGLMAMGA